MKEGYAVGSMVAGVVAAVPLDSIRRYLAGAISITGGTGLVAMLTNHLTREGEL